MTYLLHYSFSAGSILKFWKLGTTVYFSSLTVNSHFFKVAFYHGGEVWVLLDWSQELSSQRPSVHDAFPKMNAVAGERPHTPTRWTTGTLLLRPSQLSCQKNHMGLLSFGSTTCRMNCSGLVSFGLAEDWTWWSSSQLPKLTLVT